MGFSDSPSSTHKFFLLANYILLGAATSCIFLTLSLRLVPSPVGILLILLHLLTILPSAFAASFSDRGSTRRHVAHMAATVLVAVLQGAVALLGLTRTAEFLWALRSYVRAEEGVVIVRMVGVLGVVMFCLEWVVLVLAFVVRFYVYAEGRSGAGPRLGSAKAAGLREEEAVKDWPWPFQL